MDNSRATTITKNQCDPTWLISATAPWLFSGFAWWAKLRWCQVYHYFKKYRKYWLFFSFCKKSGWFYFRNCTVGKFGGFQNPVRWIEKYLVTLLKTNKLEETCCIYKIFALFLHLQLLKMEASASSDASPLKSLATSADCLNFLKVCMHYKLSAKGNMVLNSNSFGFF